MIERKIALTIAILTVIIASTTAPAPAVITSRAQGSTWTIMVYMAADNNLEPFALQDLDEMERAHPGNGVTVVALVDRSSEDYESGNIPPDVAESVSNSPSWDDAKIILVRPDDSPGIRSDFIKDLGEVDTGDPATLEGFIRYAASNYPADHYVLIIWDHGGGPGGAAWDDTNGQDYLTLKEMREAIEASGVHLDLIGFDACLMATIDAAYEFRSVADYMAASEETEPGYGWPYDRWLPQLVSNPGMSPEDLGRAILTSYMSFYREARIDTVTFSLTKLSPLRDEGNVGKIRDFVNTAVNNPQPLQQARMMVQTFGGGDDPVYGANQVDLIDLLTKAQGSYGEAATAFINLLNEIIVESDSYGPQVAGAHGLSAHYPLRYDRSVYTRETSFSTDLNWAGLLDVAVNVQPELSDQPAEGVAGGEIRLYSDYPLSTAQFGSAGPMDFDGDGSQEFVVFSIGLGTDGTYYALLSISKYFSGTGLAEVYDTDVDYGSATDGSNPFNIGGVMGGDIDGDGADEFIDAYSYVDMGSETVYTSVDRYEYAGEGTVNSDYNLIEGLIATTADLGDLGGDGGYEVAVGGYFINMSTYEVGGRLYLIDASTLEKIAYYEFSNPDGNFTEVSELATGDLIEGGGHELVIGYNTGDIFPNGSYVIYSGHIAVTYLQGTDLYVMASRDFSGQKIVSVTTGDIDSDGYDEIMYVTQDPDGSLTLYAEEVTPEGSLHNLGVWQISAESPNSAAYVQTYDLDGDGITELLITIVEYDAYGDLASAVMEMYSYIPSQNDFSYEGSIDMSGEYSIPIPTDLNGDGHMDVVYLTQRSDGVYLSIGQVENYVNPTGDVEGTVLDAQGNPVPGAYVEIMLPRATYYANTTTDSEGRFSFTGVPAGTYQVSAYWGTGGETHYAQEIITVEEGGKTSVTLQEEAPTTITTTTTPPATTTTTTTATTTTTSTTTTTPPQTTTTSSTTTTTTSTTTTITTSTTTTTTSTTTSTTSTTTTTGVGTGTTTTQETTTTATSETPPSAGFDWGLFGAAAGGAAVAVIIVGLILMRRRAPPPPPPPPA